MQQQMTELVVTPTRTEPSADYHHRQTKTQLNGSVKQPNISIYFFFPPITQCCSVSDVLFTGGMGVSDFSVLKYIIRLIY